MKNAARLAVGISESCPKEKGGVDVSQRSAYASAVAQAGHAPFILPRFAPGGDCAALLERMDVLLVAGGPDVAPARYGEAATPLSNPPNLVRDRFEFALVAAARKIGMPVLGICRGCQLLNVAFGGTLWQDIPDGRGAFHRKSRHSIRIEKDSLLFRMAGAASPKVNSSHHQAVREPALGFRVSAKAPDGTIEAIESECYRAMGLQFHPERLVAFGHNRLWKSFFSRLAML